jgi:phosphoribosylformylglycinamidine cyclo-ligase
MNEHLTYKGAGVDSDQQDRIMPNLTHWVERTFQNRPNTVKLPLGYFANVIDMGGGVGLALSTDGVGTKILVAELLHKYDTVGIDCVAMNVNDVLCVGATPLAMLDYVAVESPHDDLMGPLIQGLYRGAEIARITIPGGEIAQVREMIRGIRPGYAFDLVGTCVGSVNLDKILNGRTTAAGDLIVGLRSTGVHSNGLSLARRVFFAQIQWDPGKYVSELGRTIGEELLEPTRIYVREVLAMFETNLRIKALAHITSSGFLNLARADTALTYVLDSLPEPHPIFRLIQHYGGISDEEMFFTYNMGIGFCVVVAPEDAESVRTIAHSHGVESAIIGHMVDDDEKREVRIPHYRLTGSGGKFSRA